MKCAIRCDYYNTCGVSNHVTSPIAQVISSLRIQQQRDKICQDHLKNAAIFLKFASQYYYEVVQGYSVDDFTRDYYAVNTKGFNNYFVSRRKHKQYKSQKTWQ